MAFGLWGAHQRRSSGWDKNKEMKRPGNFSLWGDIKGSMRAVNAAEGFDGVSGPSKYD